MTYVFTHYGTTVQSGKIKLLGCQRLYSILLLPEHNSFSTLSIKHMFFFPITFQVIEAVVNKECEEVLTAEMAKIKVEFKLFEEFNRLTEM